MRWLRYARRVPHFFRPMLVELERRVAPSFVTGHAFAAGIKPTSVAVGDFNGDGIPDLAVGDFGFQGNGSGVGVLLGNGDGSFQAARTFAGGAEVSVAVGDFNGDGRLDLAVTNYGFSSSSVSVLLGNGDGSFQAARSFLTGPQSTSVAVGDFNGDGTLDLAVANFRGVDVLLGNGDGSFQPARTFSAGYQPHSLAVGDFTGDGHLDLAVANYGSADVSVLLGNGDGSFQAARNYSAGGSPLSVAVGDFTGDGHLDLAIANYSPDHPGTVSVLLGNGDGSFQPAQSFVAGFEPYSVAVGDLNGDGRLDLVVADYGYLNRDAAVSVLLGNGDGTFQTARSFSAGSRPRSVVVGDFNGDGRLDLAVADYGNDNVSVLLGNGDGSFPAAPSYTTGPKPASVVVGDFTGSRIPDLAVANTGYYPNSGSLSVLLGNGDGSFKAPADYDLRFEPSAVVAGDFNGDGTLDLAMVNNSTPGVVGVLLGNGDGSFQAPRGFAAGDAPVSMAVGDFNGDGIPDLAVASFFGVNVLLGNGDGSFQAPRLFAAGSSPASVAVGDFNGDGVLDLAVANSAYFGRSPSVSVLLGNGDGSFQAQRTFVAGSSPESVAVGDFTGDGVLDLAVANAPFDQPGSVSVLLGNGDGTFQAQRTFSAGPDPRSVAVGDLNQDGRLDLAVAGKAGVNVLLGNGDGSFQTTDFSYDAGTDARSVAVADLNGDNWPDLAVANNGSDDVSILLNDRHWPRHQPPTRSPLPAAQPVAGGVGGVVPQALRHLAIVPEAPLFEPAFDLPAAGLAGPVADPAPAPPSPAVAQPERFVRPAPVPGAGEAAPRTPLPTAALALPRPIRASVFAPALATGIDGKLVDDRNSLPA